MTEPWQVLLSWLGDDIDNYNNVTRYPVALLLVLTRTISDTCERDIILIFAVCVNR